MIASNRVGWGGWCHLVRLKWCEVVNVCSPGEADVSCVIVHLVRWVRWLMMFVHLVRHSRQMVWEQGSSLGMCSWPSNMPEIGNWELVIGNRQLAIGHWKLAVGNWVCAPAHQTCLELGDILSISLSDAGWTLGQINLGAGGMQILGQPGLCCFGKGGEEVKKT